MNYTTQFPTELLTETLILGDSQPNRSLPMNRKTYATQRILRESTASLLKRHFHLGAFLATIFFSAIALLIIYFTQTNSDYTYSKNNDILYRTHRTTKQVDYLWPGQSAWRAISIPTPSVNSNRPTPQPFAEFMRERGLLKDFGRSIKARYPEYNDMDDLDVGQRVKAKYPHLYEHFINPIPIPTPDGR